MVPENYKLINLLLDKGIPKILLVILKVEIWPELYGLCQLFLGLSQNYLEGTADKHKHFVAFELLVAFRSIQRVLALHHPH